MEMKNSTVIRVPAKLDYSFFRLLVEFLTPIHKLSSRNADVFAALLFERYKFSKMMSVVDERVVGELLGSTDTKNRICEFLGIKPTHYSVILQKLRQAKLVGERDINPKFIPMFTNGEGDYKLIIHFDIRES